MLENIDPINLSENVNEENIKETPRETHYRTRSVSGCMYAKIK